MIFKFRWLINIAKLYNYAKFQSLILIFKENRPSCSFSARQNCSYLAHFSLRLWWLITFLLHKLQWWDKNRCIYQLIIYHWPKNFYNWIENKNLIEEFLKKAKTQFCGTHSEMCPYNCERRWRKWRSWICNNNSKPVSRMEFCEAFYCRRWDKRKVVLYRIWNETEPTFRKSVKAISRLYIHPQITRKKNTNNKAYFFIDFWV